MLYSPEELLKPEQLIDPKFVKISSLAGLKLTKTDGELFFVLVTRYLIVNALVDKLILLSTTFV